MPTVPREAQELADRAREDTGAHILFKPANNGHFQVTNGRTRKPIRDERGMPLFVPSSPSDWRTWRNHAAEWRAAGLITKPTKTERHASKLDASAELAQIDQEIAEIARRYANLKRRRALIASRA